MSAALATAAVEAALTAIEDVEGASTSVRYYTLEEAAELLKFPSVPALRTFLCRERDYAAPRYVKRGLREIRLLSEFEIDAIRRTRVK